MKNRLDKLQAEQEHIRTEIEALKRQVELLHQRVREHEAPSLPDHPPARRAGAALSAKERTLLHRLPETFTVEDLIRVSEEVGLEVFESYRALQILLASGYVTKQGETFRKTRLGPSGPASSGSGSSAEYR